MSVSMHELSIATFTRMLRNLSGFIDKAAAYAEERKFDGKVLAAARLAPDMLPLTTQVQIAGDFAKGTAARLAGIEPPKFEDNEATLADLKTRIARTLEFLDSVKPEQLAGSEDRVVSHQLRDRTLSMPGKAYVLGFSLPNFYFHVTTAYDILRHNGVNLGKKDFLA